MDEKKDQLNEPLLSSEDDLETGLPNAAYSSPDQFNLWLNCSIGASNRGYFIIGCFLALATLLTESYVTLTSVCYSEPFMDFGDLQILMPIDCKSVYEQYK